MITAIYLLLAVPVNRVRVQGVLELQQGAIARSRLHSRPSRKHGGGGHGGQGGLLHQLHPHHHDHYGDGGHGGQGGLHPKCPHYTIFTNIRVIIMTRQYKDCLAMIISTLRMTRNTCPGSRERKKPSQCSFEGSLCRYFQLQVQLQAFLRTARENDFCDIQVICFHR